MQLRRFLVRNTDAPQLVELFLIASVFSVLAIRAFLAAAGYPQPGGDGLHIAHMLWGGVFMVLALLMLFSFLGRAAQKVSAILAGIGFGTFIDELGKFITSDNDYFFQPTIGIIYIIFIGVVLLIRVLHQNRKSTLEEAVANILNQLGAAAGGRLDSRSKREAMDLMATMEPANPSVRALREYIGGLDTEEGADRRLYSRLSTVLIRYYSRVVLNRLFAAGLTGLFVLFSIL